MPKNSIFSSLFLALSLLLSPLSGLWAESGKQQIVLISDPELSDFLEILAKPLIEEAGLLSENVRFHVILNSDLNAMALPSNDIILNSGLLLRAESRDEVAGVMAHEIAHLSAGHHIQLKSELKNLSLQSLLFGALGVAAGVASGDSRVAQATIMGGTAAGHTHLLAGQRRKETQADRLAVLYLSKAGFEPQGLSAFMERIQKEQKGSTLPPPYLLSHPLSSTRLVEIRQMAKDNRPSFQRPESEKEVLIRVQAKLLAASIDPPDPIIQQFESQLKKDPNHHTARYGLGVAQRYAGKLPESESHFTRLLTQYIDDPYILWERGRTRVDWGKMVEAENDFRKALLALPKNQDFLYWLAFTLSEQKKYQGAGRILRKLTIKYPRDSQYFYLLGMVEGKNNRPASGHLALGRYYALRQEYTTALWHLNESIRLFPEQSIERNIAKEEKSRVNALVSKKE
ncbi:MAG: M48 family metalloprotease [Magnetococcales bacterium]|nr:M48 family metalloprotease [Magnetococcales bacterium]